MVARYSLQSTVKGETDPVTLIIHQTADTNEQLELLLAVEGAKTLKLVPGRDLDGAKIMMRAGASFSRHQGVRLSNGFNVVDLGECPVHGCAGREGHIDRKEARTP